MRCWNNDRKHVLRELKLHLVVFKYQFPPVFEIVLGFASPNSSILRLPTGAVSTHSAAYSLLSMKIAFYLPCIDFISQEQIFISIDFSNNFSDARARTIL